MTGGGDFHPARPAGGKTVVMNRRSFIAGIGAALSGAVLDPDQLLWRPGARLISVPRPSRPSRPSRNVLLAPQVVTHMVMVRLQNNLDLQRALNAQYRSSLRSTTPASRSAIRSRVRVPHRFLPRT
jgi:hypothetical protein